MKSKKNKMIKKRRDIKNQFNQKQKRKKLMSKMSMMLNLLWLKMQIKVLHHHAIPLNTQLRTVLVFQNIMRDKELLGKQLSLKKNSQKMSSSKQKNLKKIKKETMLMSQLIKLLRLNHKTSK